MINDAWLAGLRPAWQVLAGFDITTERDEYFGEAIVTCTLHGSDCD